MKKLLSFTRLMLLAMLPLVFFSCGGDDDPTPQVLQPKLDGVYVYGTNTVAEAPTEPAARLSGAILNPAKSGGQQTVDGVYGKFMYIGANSTLQISEVDNEVATVYGAVGGGSVVAGAELEDTDIDANFITGELVPNGAPIQVNEEGLYYLFVNTNEDMFRLMKVEAQMFGDAQPGQWTSGTPLPMVSASAEGAVFEGTALNLKGESGYKYRFNRGYEVFNNGEIATLTFLGVESYGQAWDTGINDLIYKDENIPQKETGVFTVRLEYDAATGEWTETKIRDYSTTQMGLFGNAYLTADGEEANWASGEDGFGLHTPTKEGSVYTWTWNDVNLIEGREFIFLENGAWGGLQIDYTGATVEGSAITGGQIVDATTIGNEYHNFYVATGGTYDITLKVNVETGARTVIISNN